MHPKRYPGDLPVDVELRDLAGRLGGGWSEAWQQTMGELRTGVWLADGGPGKQESVIAPVKLPRAAAATGWGGDRLVSLDGPDGTWAIVWQTTWDSAADADEFAKAGAAVTRDQPGSAVSRDDVSGGLDAPVLVLVTSDADTLAAVQTGLGVTSAG
jgi:hypothetical protein